LGTLFGTDRNTRAAIWDPTIHYTRPDGRPCQGYYASPASRDRAAGIVVIQEWWGVNDQIKGIAGLNRRWWV
jgi:dienelactone hydrolase